MKSEWIIVNSGRSNCVLLTATEFSSEIYNCMFYLETVYSIESSGDSQCNRIFVYFHSCETKKWIWWTFSNDEEC